MVGGIKRIASLYTKVIATRKGSDAARGPRRDLGVDLGVEGRVEARRGHRHLYLHRRLSYLPLTHPLRRRRYRWRRRQGRRRRQGWRRRQGVPLPLLRRVCGCEVPRPSRDDRYRSEEHTSLQSPKQISYAVSLIGRAHV